MSGEATRWARVSVLYTWMVFVAVVVTPGLASDAEPAPLPLDKAVMAQMASADKAFQEGYGTDLAADDVGDAALLSLDDGQRVVLAFCNTEGRASAALLFIEEPQGTWRLVDFAGTGADTAIERVIDIEQDGHVSEAQCRFSAGYGGTELGVTILFSVEQGQLHVLYRARDVGRHGGGGIAVGDLVRDYVELAYRDVLFDENLELIETRCIERATAVSEDGLGVVSKTHTFTISTITHFYCAANRRFRPLARSTDGIADDCSVDDQDASETIP